MDATTLLGSRLTQLGIANEVERIERTHGRRAARRRAAEALAARGGARRPRVAAK